MHVAAAQVDDLVDEEEVPAAAARGLDNVMSVYNTDLRSLYDKYWCASTGAHVAVHAIQYASAASYAAQ
jgi:hypothetical protein